MPLDLTDHKSTLVQVMAWCRQATSHYLNQCWHRSLPPYGVTRPHWVNGVWLMSQHILSTKPLTKYVMMHHETSIFLSLYEPSSGLMAWGLFNNRYLNVWLLSIIKGLDTCLSNQTIMTLVEATKSSYKCMMIYLNRLGLIQNCRHFPDDIFQSIFVNENYEIGLRFHWSLFLKSNKQYSSIGSDNGLAPTR